MCFILKVQQCVYTKALLGSVLLKSCPGQKFTTHYHRNHPWQWKLKCSL